MEFINFINHVSNGGKWKINLIEKKLFINKKECELEPASDKQISIDEIKSLLGKLYHSYKYSYPSERSEKNANGYYFKALSADEMTDEQLVCGLDREVTRAVLEGTVLMMSTQGKLKSLFATDNQWFWKNEEGLVILKDWC